MFIRRFSFKQPKKIHFGSSGCKNFKIYHVYVPLPVNKLTSLLVTTLYNFYYHKFTHGGHIPNDQ